MNIQAVAWDSFNWGVSGHSMCYLHDLHSVLVPIWIQRFSLYLAVRLPLFSFFFFFFFFTHFREGETKFTVYETNVTVHALFWYCLCTVHGTHSYFIQKNIKNGSHSTIYTFKNYFVTVFSVFSFQFSISATISSIQTDP